MFLYLRVLDEYTEGDRHIFLTRLRKYIKAAEPHLSQHLRSLFYGSGGFSLTTD